jgi:hypothetical protein
MMDPIVVFLLAGCTYVGAADGKPAGVKSVLRKLSESTTTTQKGQSTMNKLSLPLSLLIALSAGCFMTTETEETMSVMHFKDAGATTSSSGNLIDHGGKVLPSSNTYAIWWGNQAAFPTDAKSGIDALFEGLNGSAFFSVASQYMRGAAQSTVFHTNWTDTSSPPTHSPSVSNVVGEACKVITHNGMQPDSSAVYFVYTSNFPHQNSFCAWHGHSYCNGVDIQVAYMPNVSGITGCDPGDLYGCNSYSEGTRALANVSSHELMEALTDADLSAWYDTSGSENMDKCAWQFNSCVSLTTGSWQLQEEWSNSNNGCVQ